MRNTLRLSVIALTLLTLSSGRMTAQQAVPHPDQYFGFKIGTDGELARYPKILEYFQLLAKQTDRVKYEELGKTTMGNSYPLLRDQLAAEPGEVRSAGRDQPAARRSARLDDAEAQKLAAEGKPFYFVYATIHSTEVWNGQAIINIVHRLATENTPMIRQILDNRVVLMVPSQNPDGQHLVIDHWYKTKGTHYSACLPDLYHKYVGHDDNRDWFMFTQKETRMNIEAGAEQVQADHHSRHAPAGRRRLAHLRAAVHRAVRSQHASAAAHGAEHRRPGDGARRCSRKARKVWRGKPAYDMWSPARQYMVYHGQPRILTEIANSALADPVKSANGRPFGPQESLGHFPVPYSKDTWTLGQQVDYGITAALAGMTHVAKYGPKWLGNYYRVHKDNVNCSGGPYAFVVPAAQRDPYGAYEMLDILKFGDVEIHNATAPFTANGKQYPAGSLVIKTAQPTAAFAKTMLREAGVSRPAHFPWRSARAAV